MMKPELLFKNYRAMRRFSLSAVSGVSDEQMQTIPEGAANNILWNLGHVIADECNMLYEPSGLPSPLPETFHTHFDPESSPKNWDVPIGVAEVLKQSETQAETLYADYSAGRFAGFEPYDLSERYALGSIEEAIAYCTIHEAMHIGVMITLKRQVAGLGTTH